jgi:hypothetical protein
MIEYLRAQIYKLLDLILAPFWEWLSKSSWTVRFAVFFVCSSALGAIVYPAGARDVLLRSSCFFQALSANGASIPFPETTLEKLKAVRSHLALSVKNDVANLNAGILTPWSSAQAVLALSATGIVEQVKSDNVIAFIRNKKVTGCGCWHEIPGMHPSDPVCVFASGWIIAAMAAVDVAVQGDELSFILGTQSPDGWWAMFPVNTEQSAYASSYATGWNILGLQTQLDKGLVPIESRLAVSNAIKRGAAWLLNVRGNGSRWSSYPNTPGSKTSEAISGLVIHALHHTVPDQTGEIERDWLTNLPAIWTKIEDTDPVYVEVFSGGKLVGIDQFVQIRLPWMLVATIDSYSSGTAFNRSTALFWLNKVLSQKSVANADVGLANWWRAEFLFSLGHILRSSD